VLKSYLLDENLRTEYMFFVLTTIIPSVSLTLKRRSVISFQCPQISRKFVSSHPANRSENIALKRRVCVDVYQSEYFSLLRER
jgi:hypothetical protein